MEIYAAMVSDLDTYVGEVIAYLKKTGQFDNTLIMFMSGQWRGTRPPRPAMPPSGDHVGKEYDHSLRESRQRATTYVMYGANWASASATPFFRHKASGWEGGIHVPAFVHYPKQGDARHPQRCHGHRDGSAAHLPRRLPARSIPGTQFRGQAGAAAARQESLLPLFYGQSEAGACR